MSNQSLTKALSCLLFFVCSDLLLADNDPARQTSSFQIVGYLPDYRVAKLETAVCRHLTDVVFFSVTPEPTGKFESPVLTAPKSVELLKKLRDNHVRVHLCVGGWDRSKGFAEIAATQESRRAFASGLTAYCLEHYFAGADIDWEHPENATQSTDYGLLLSEISRQFHRHNLTLTAAIAGWQSLTTEGIAALDGINLMSYDADGKHSTLEQAEADVQKLLKTGVPPQKIRLGVPFYGRGIKQRDLTKTYAEIAATPGSADTDELDGIYFNGPATIRAKTRFAIDQKLGGIMVWEIGQDAPGNASLLRVVHDEAAKANKQR